MAAWVPHPGFALAMRQCRAELMATQSWLQDEMAEMRKEFVAACAELASVTVDKRPSQPCRPSHEKLFKSRFLWPCDRSQA